MEERIRARLADYYDPGDVDVWLQARQPLLSDARPIDLIRNGRANEVIRLLDQLDAGVYL